MFKKITPAAAPAAAREKAVSIMQQLPPHYPVLSAEALLRGKQYPQILSQIQTLAYTSDWVFDSLYTKSIHNYAEFVQGLPATHVDNFNYHGGLLELGVRRALQTLAWYRREHPIKQYTPDNLPARQAIWSYALFTAGLLYGVGQVVATYWVMLCHMNGQPNKIWNAAAGKMADQEGEYYRYSFETTRRDELAARSTLVLALQILPAEGIAWIASDKEIFNAWLAILLRDEEHAGLFAQCVIPVNAELEGKPNQEAGFIFGDEIEQLDIEGTQQKNPELNDNDPPPQQSLAHSDMFTHNPEHHTQLGANNEIGLAFIIWLRNNIRAQSLNVSRDMVIAPEGSFINQALIERFAAENTRFGNSQNVFNKLKNSAFALGQATPQAMNALIGLAQQDKRTGILLDTAAIFGKKLPGNGITYAQHLVVTGAANHPPVLQQLAAKMVKPSA